MDMNQENNKQKLDLETLEHVAGGVYQTVDTGVDGLNAVVRTGPSKTEKQIASLPNGTVVDQVGDLVYDRVSQRYFAPVTYIDKNGTLKNGWIAASIIGIRR